MGDRTSVSLRVPTELAEQAKEIFEAFDGGCNDEYLDGERYVFCFDEVNYGNLRCLDDLQEAGIAYDSEWGAGGDYGPGTKSCRFTKEGEVEVKEISDDQYGISVGYLLPHIDDHAKLKELILAHQEKISVLPWDDQVDYGMTYKIKQLITPNHQE